MSGKAFRQHKVRHRRKKKKKTRSYAWVKVVCGICFVMVVLYFGADYCGLFNQNQSSTGPEKVVTQLDWRAGFPTAEEVDAKPKEGNVITRLAGWAKGNISGSGDGSNSGSDQAAGSGEEIVDPSVLAVEPVSVYIANGCGVNKFAARFRQELRDAGFDVMGTSNADQTDYLSTLIVDRSGIKGRAEEVCSYFQARWGVGRIISQKRDAPMTDVLVVLGKDLSQKVAAEQEQP